MNDNPVVIYVLVLLIVTAFCGQIIPYSLLYYAAKYGISRDELRKIAQDFSQPTRWFVVNWLFPDLKGELSEQLVTKTTQEVMSYANFHRALLTIIPAFMIVAFASRPAELSNLCFAGWLLFVLIYVWQFGSRIHKIVDQ